MSSEKMSFKKRIGIIKRSIGLVEEADKGRTLRYMLGFVPEAVTTFSGIYLSSLVIDGVTAAKPVSELLLRAAVICGINLAVSIMHRLIDMRHSAQEFTFFNMSMKRLWEKVMDMDYAKAENTDTKHKYQNAADNFENGSGIRGIPELMSYAADSAIRIIAGIILIVPMIFGKPSAAGGFMGFIQSPWGFIAMLALTAGFVAVTTCFVVPLQVKETNAAIQDENVHEAQRFGGAVQERVYNYRSGKEIRIYAEQQLMTDKYADAVTVVNNVWWKCVKKLYLADWIETIDQFILMVLTYSFALIRAAGGMMTPGEIVAFAMYFSEIRDGFMRASGCINQLLSRAELYSQVFDFLDIPDDKYKGTIPTEKRDDDMYEFEFKNVSFKYPGTDNYVLKNIDLKWKIGEKMALVGRNGSGKSTLVKLLCRLYDPTEGEITLNGIDIRKYSLKEYTDLFSVVFQDSALFSMPMGENVAADIEYDREYAEECIRRAGLSDRFDEMPDGLDTCLYKDFDEKGVEISGGEAQKLCLARAIYKGSPFIVLDEPTAALDPVSEYDIYTKFNSIVGTKTAIYISHRLSSCRFCDDITVLDGGELVERGDHDTLLSKGGVYAKMWSAQAEYYKNTAGELYK